MHSAGCLSQALATVLPTRRLPAVRAVRMHAQAKPAAAVVRPTLALATAEDALDVAGTLGGDQQAYARLVHRYQQPIAGQMWRLCRSAHDCEDLVQRVFVEAYFSLRRYRGEAPLLHWLRKIATRVGYRYCKEQARRQQRGETTLHDCGAEPTTGLDEQERSEAAAAVQAKLAQLPPRDRLVLTLIYLEGCSVSEASQLTGWSQTMVKVQAHRARKKLGKLLELAPL